jgi:hypothetical protein
MKGSIHQENILVNIYLPNMGPPKHVNKVLDLMERYTNIIIDRNINILLSSMDRLYKQKNQQRSELNYTIQPMGLTIVI